MLLMLFSTNSPSELYDFFFIIESLSLNDFVFLLIFWISCELNLKRRLITTLSIYTSSRIHGLIAFTFMLYLSAFKDILFSINSMHNAHLHTEMTERKKKKPALAKRKWPMTFNAYWRISWFNIYCPLFSQPKLLLKWMQFEDINCHRMYSQYDSTQFDFNVALAFDVNFVYINRILCYCCVFFLFIFFRRLDRFYFIHTKLEGFSNRNNRNLCMRFVHIFKGVHSSKAFAVFFLFINGNWMQHNISHSNGTNGITI